MRNIILGLLFIVTVIAVAAGLTFYQLQSHPSDDDHRVKTAERAPTPEEERLKRVREERAAAREKEIAEQKALDDAIDAARAGIPAETRGDNTYYKFNEDKTRGLYFAPILVDGKQQRFIMDIVYYYDIHDGTNLAWLHGDTFAIHADGIPMQWKIDGERRHDNIAPNAESLTERYQDSIDIDDMRRIAEAHTVTLYYTGEGKTRTRVISATEQEEIQRLVALFDLLEKRW